MWGMMTRVRLDVGQKPRLVADARGHEPKLSAARGMGHLTGRVGCGLYCLDAKPQWNAALCLKLALRFAL